MLKEIATAPRTTPEQRRALIQLKTAALTQLADSGDSRALPLSDSLIKDLENLHGKHSTRLIEHLRTAARLYQAQGKSAQALALLKRAYQLAIVAFGNDDPANRFLLNQLADAYAATGRIAEASAAKAKAANLEQIAAAVLQPPDTLGGGDAHAAQAAYQIVPVHFRTTRKLTGRSEPASSFSSERGSEDAFGITYVSVPKERDIGAIPQASIFRFDFSADPGRHVITKEVVQLPGRAAFFDTVKTRLAPTDHKEVLIYIHGFNQSFVNSMETAATLAADLELDGAVIAYSWPSKNRLLRYQADVDEVGAFRNQQALQDLLAETAASTGAQHVYVVAHSLGNRLLLEALKLMPAATGPYFDSLVFASPDVESRDFSELLPTLAPLSRHMTLYTADDDLALGFSAAMRNSIFGAEHLVRAGDSNGGISSTNYLDVVDASLAKADFLGHADFAYLAKDDLRALLWFGLRAQERCLLEKPRPDGWRYAATPPCTSQAFQLAALYRRRLGSVASALTELAPNQNDNARLARDILRQWSPPQASQ